jgi:hypothetical protein
MAVGYLVRAAADASLADAILTVADAWRLAIWFGQRLTPGIALFVDRSTGKKVGNG